MAKDKNKGDDRPGGNRQVPDDSDLVAGDVRRAMRRLARHNLTPSTVTPSTFGKGALTRGAAPPNSTEIRYRRDLPRENAAPRPYMPVPTGNVALAEAVKGSESRVPDMGAAYKVSIRANDIELAGEVSETFRTLIASTDSPLCKRIATVCDPEVISHEDVLFMDVESTGFGNSALFLIGVMLWDGDCFEVQQFFARNYSEERAVIAMFLDTLKSHRLLVTFNGKSFDVPYIRARAAATSVKFEEDPWHLDMLHVCRRIWRDKLPNCKLQTLETYICNRIRQGDIPGSEIPDAYHEYVRTENAWQMVDVLKHNMLDLVTMADLMNRFPAEKTSEQEGIQ